MQHIILHHIGHSSDVIQDPENATAFLDKSAVFKCETTGGSTSWYVNGTLLETLPPNVQRDLLEPPGINTPDGTRLENLTIPARAEYNGTRVQCVVFTADGLTAIESESATFRIQGNYTHNI